MFAKAGNIGGWVIDPNRLYFPATSTSVGVGIEPGSAPTSAVFWSGFKDILHDENNVTDCPEAFYNKEMELGQGITKAAKWRDYTTFYV